MKTIGEDELVELTHAPRSMESAIRPEQFSAAVECNKMLTSRWCMVRFRIGNEIRWVWVRSSDIWERTYRKGPNEDQPGQKWPPIR